MCKFVCKRTSWLRARVYKRGPFVSRPTGSPAAAERVLQHLWLMSRTDWTTLNTENKLLVIYRLELRSSSPPDFIESTILHQLYTLCVLANFEHFLYYSFNYACALASDSTIMFIALSKLTIIIIIQ